MKFLLGCEEILASSFLSALFTPENPHKFLINKDMTVIHEFKKKTSLSERKLRREGLPTAKIWTPWLRSFCAGSWTLSCDLPSVMRMQICKLGRHKFITLSACWKCSFMFGERVTPQTFDTSRLDAELNKLSATYLRPAPVRVFPPL